MHYFASAAFDLNKTRSLACQPFVKRTEGAGIRFPIEMEKRTVGFVQIQDCFSVPHHFDGART